jgi:hypothetical protein
VLNLPARMKDLGPARIQQRATVDRLRKEEETLLRSAQRDVNRLDQLAQEFRQESEKLLRLDVKVLELLREEQEAMVLKVGGEVDAYRPHMNYLKQPGPAAPLDADPPFLPDVNASGAVPGRATVVLDPGTRAVLDDALRAYGPDRLVNGIVYYNNRDGETLALTGDLVQQLHAGHLTLVATGNVDASDLTAGAGGPLCVVCYGTLSARGPVEASLFALAGFRQTGLKLRGVLYLNDENGDGAFATAGRPEDVLNGLEISIDPRVKSWDPDRDTIPPESLDLILGPFPCHEALERVGDP